MNYLSSLCPCHHVPCIISAFFVVFGCPYMYYQFEFDVL
uniref:Uncharacterized protein n=1 Tax=Rhizophora mucronata TaxID=61149 RepID=A0A2P2MHZ0_RHIMU